MSQSILEYRGRVPKRSGSILRRDAIFNATLNIIKKEGVRGVKHRAVADMAEVPLSATTYYFKDIDELIVDSFVYFTQYNIAYQQKAFAEILSMLKNPGNSGDKKVVAKKIKTVFIQYIEQQINDQDARIIERSFLQYAARVPELALKVNQIRQYLELSIEDVLIALEVDNAKTNAYIIISTILYLEENAILGKKMESKFIETIVSALLNELK